mgnify:CR=1 FL=1
MQLGAGLLTIKLPVNSSSTFVAFGFQSCYLFNQSRLVSQPAVETLPLEDAYLDFCHIQPACVFRRVVKFQLSEQPSCLGWLENFIQRSWFMSVEVVLHYSDYLRVWVSLIHQPFNEFGIVDGRAALGYCYVPKTGFGFNQHKQVGSAIANVFVVFSLRFTLLDWQSSADFLMQLLALFVQTHYWPSRVQGFFVEFEYIFHGGYKGGIYFRQAPMLTLPRFQIVFLRVRRMVS